MISLGLRIVGIALLFVPPSPSWFRKPKTG
ncbi:hypothetical protein SAMN05444161_4119 [Rhizobiales bacterium GAS191]|nr:hypothetical protein SAMN05444161_4119 [Rhizobiales bacterium GAS191]